MPSMYHSTRSRDLCCPSKEAILEGLAPDGGLFVTDELGHAAFAPDAFAHAGYYDIARAVLGALLDDYSPAEIAECVEAAYGTFDSPDPDTITPLAAVGNAYVLELFRGPTSAFKDVALQMLPQLMSRAAKGTDKRIMILTATSGDTGKAALAGFANTPGLGISVFYPDGGTSAIQRLQMVTQQGANVAVAAVKGNFDDTQSTVKAIFGDAALCARLAEKGITLSSANSINVGRLVPQVVYYFDAYAQLVRRGAIAAGDPVEFCVPTGNFGDVLAGYYAKRMGLPVSKLIVASNANNVLTDFLATGVYDRNRPFFKTISPSMDILISSNLERLLYYACGCDTDYVAECMAQLKAAGRYQVSDEVLARIQQTFACGWASDDAARATMRACFEATGYVLDPHTAVGYHVSEGIACQAAARVVLSTASPFKFCRDVCAALGFSSDGSDFDCLRELEAKTGLSAPAALANLEAAPVRFDQVIAADDMPAFVETQCLELL